MHLVNSLIKRHNLNIFLVLSEFDEVKMRSIDNWAMKKLLLFPPLTYLKN